MCNATHGIPTVRARPEGETPTGRAWNYIPQLEEHYPAGYVYDKMWDLTEVDYWDSPFGKGHPWHLDNLLPNVDSPVDKPHNVIAFPLYKVPGPSRILACVCVCGGACACAVVRVHVSYCG